jgi:hypothetical protein
MTIYNHYEFKHVDEDTTYLVSFNADMADSVIDAFVQFMAGCGYSHDYIYSYLEEIAQMHFEAQKKLDALEKHLTDD